MEIGAGLRDSYYFIKPLIPRWIQIFLRRRIVLRKRLKCSNVWPIHEKAGKAPKGWTEWPGAKRFALVLTHDVDTARGIQRCIPLAELEESLGFRSAFNFVCERYDVPSALRNYLREHGFEIGIHGLTHKGNPFRSRRIFEKQAKKMNGYLKDWKCVGHRSPCMYNNLDWIGDLNIEYDSSTFDTDPFEPQPDGVGTIFPFWVPADGRAATTPAISLTPGTIRPEVQPVTCNLQPATVSQRGYVELPYTLPQDFTLLVLMNAKSINIWRLKLDWIVEHGGMALINTHPDYMAFDGRKPTIEEYPIRYYEEFLLYVKGKYKDEFWHALPQEVASFWKNNFMVNRRAGIPNKEGSNSGFGQAEG
jgi:peptidoglycan/xylan/chitin deacetylase (PgdA/CDA1 family)